MNATRMTVEAKLNAQTLEPDKAGENCLPACNRVLGDTTNVKQGCSDVRNVFLYVVVSVVVVMSNPMFTPTLTPFETATRAEELHRVQRFCT
jgi:hypothetical protein